MKSKTVKIDATPVTIRELTVTEVSALFGMDQDTNLIDRLEFMLGCCSDMDIKAIMKHSPSDLQPLIDALIEVNASFFAQADQVGMAAAAEVLKNLLQSLSMIVFVRSSQPDTGQESGVTPGRSSQTP